VTWGGSAVTLGALLIWKVNATWLLLAAAVTGWAAHFE